MFEVEAQDGSIFIFVNVSSSTLLMCPIFSYSSSHKHGCHSLLVLKFTRTFIFFHEGALSSDTLETLHFIKFNVPVVRDLAQISSASSAVLASYIVEFMVAVLTLMGVVYWRVGAVSYDAE